MHYWWRVGDAGYSADRYFLITLCSSALTLCSSSLTLCCACGVATDAWGVRMLLIFTCNFLMSAHPFAVVSGSCGHPQQGATLVGITPNMVDFIKF